MVWDLPLRITHWLLAIAVAGAWITHYVGTQAFAWHQRFGYAVLVLVLFRIAWGFVGTRHARFVEFVRGPAAIVRYLNGGAASTVPGHNPLGALSVIVMLLLLLVQAATGLFANDEIANTGPFYGWISHGLSNRLTSLHHENSEWLLVLIGLHLVAVAYYVRFRRQPLVRAMITGHKPQTSVEPGQAISSSRTALAIAIVLALCGGLALAVRSAPEASLSVFF
jgi:cytochrome b